MASEGVVCLLLGSGGLLVFRPVGLPLSEAAFLRVLPVGWEGRGAEGWDRALKRGLFVL